MRRLLLVAVLVLAGCGGASDPAAENRQLDAVELVRALQDGGLVVYIRHGATDQSEVDRNISDLERCEGQRNLTELGREQARTIGKAFRALEIPVGTVLASEYCRTRQTARLAFGDVKLDPDITGFPDSNQTELYAKRKRIIQELLATKPEPGENTILVAHGSSLEASAGVKLEEGELAVFEPHGGTHFRYLGRIPANAWPQLAEELGPA